VPNNSSAPIAAPIETYAIENAKNVEREQASVQPVKFWFLLKGGKLEQKKKRDRAAEQAHAAKRDRIHMQTL
jgi:hypothetical protein